MNKPSLIKHLKLWWKEVRLYGLIKRYSMGGVHERRLGSRDMVANLLNAFSYRKAIVFEHSGGVIMVYVETNAHMATFLQEKIKEVVPAGIVVVVKVAELLSYSGMMWIAEYQSRYEEIPPQKPIVKTAKARPQKKRQPAKKRR